MTKQELRWELMPLQCGVAALLLPKDKLLSILLFAGVAITLVAGALGLYAAHLERRRR